ncbi:MAG: hypothetical protein B7X04_00430 [Parcubacteria group bacterium 21-54-25]|nr:MAG: hypothetical protein B7X04_00430 [Parcubacteria group bacterium 21-54-25]HQU07478.1 hypothetical protein [Candidatus Paceibacterota bacterium]
MVLGITGTIGAGKGAVVAYLTATNGFTHFSARSFLERRLQERALSPTRDNMKRVADELRANHSPAYLIEQLFAEAAALGSNAVIESVRTLGEASFLQQRGVPLLAIDADRRVRYRRIVGRGLSTDHVSFAEFCRQEDAELSNTDPNQQNLTGVMARADCHIENDGSRDDLRTQVDACLAPYLHRE